MCICLIHPGDNPENPFCILFNREESLLRLTTPLHRWKEDPNIIGGRDNALGGSWLALNSKTGNIAFLTNLSDSNTKLTKFAIGKLSRGKLVGDFVSTDFRCDRITKDTIDMIKSYIDPDNFVLLNEFEQFQLNDEIAPSYLIDLLCYASTILNTSSEYNPFNLCLGNIVLGRIFYLDIVNKKITEIKKNSVNGYSNNWFIQTNSHRSNYGVDLLYHLKQNGGLDVCKCLDIMKILKGFEGKNKKQRLPIFCLPSFDHHTSRLDGTISTAMLIQVSAKTYKIIEVTYDYGISGVKDFMLKKKYSTRLKTYVKLLMFLIKTRLDKYTESRVEFEFDLN